MGRDRGDATEGGTDSSDHIARRTYIRLATAGIGLAGLAAEPDTVEAATEGYGTDGYGEGGYGSVDDGGSDTTAPSAPSNLASPSHTDTTVDLTWDGSSDSGTGVDHYNVYVDGSKANQTTTTSATVSGLSSGTSYDFYVTAVDDAGNESDSSNIITVTTWSVIGETGKVSTGQSEFSDWHTVSLNESYTNPVVIMGPISYNGVHPSHARLRRVGSGSFEFKIEEWNYLDKWHTEERASYQVMEAGTYTLPDGTKLEVGTVDIDHAWTSVSLTQSFGSTPVVLSTPQTFNGRHAIITRQQKISTNGFDIRLQEEEGNDGWHTTETVGYIAIESATGSNGATAFETGTTGTTVSSDWDSISFEQSYSTAPVFLAQIQTFNGSHPAGLRYQNLDIDTIDVFVEEEQSSDSEMWHTNENVGYLAVGSETTVYAK